MVEDGYIKEEADKAATEQLTFKKQILKLLTLSCM
jgi:hypothetical protein